MTSEIDLSNLSIPALLIRRYHESGEIHRPAKIQIIGDEVMYYAALIYGNEAAGLQMTEEQQKAQMDEYYAFTKHVMDRGIYKGGEALMPTSMATTVRVRDGKTLTTDGPFAETKEQLGGFYLIDCANLDEAIEIAARIPGARDGSIEVRPIMEIPESYQS